MAGFILIGFALYGGDLLPWSIRLLMLVGGVASWVTPFALRPLTRNDPGASYPYPTQADVYDGGDS